DLLTDRARFFLAVPRAGHLYLFAQFVFSAQRLTESAFVMSDEVGRSRKNMSGTAIISLQADDLRTGEIVVEAQDVIDFRTAPAVDRLIIIADAANVFGNAREVYILLRRFEARWRPETGLRGVGGSANLPVRRLVASRNGRHRARRRLCQQFQPQVLRDVCVLVLIDEDELESFLKIAQYVRVLSEQPDVLEQKVAEIGGIQCLQPLLIGDVQLLTLAIRKARCFTRRHLFRRKTAILPAIDQRGQDACRPPLLVELLSFEDHLDQPHLVIYVEDR